VATSGRRRDPVKRRVEVDVAEVEEDVLLLLRTPDVDVVDSPPLS
jgi:hypothetical protein